MTASIKVDGLNEVRRAISRLDRLAGTKDGAVLFRDAMKSVAQIVVDEAQRRAPKNTRKLARSIRPRVSGATARVVVNARRRSAAWPSGYRYPRRLEYGDLDRPFLRPALAAKRDEVEREMDVVLDAIEKAWEAHA